MSHAATSMPAAPPVPALTRSRAAAIIAAVLAVATWSLWPLGTPAASHASLSPESPSPATTSADTHSRDEASPDARLPELDLAAYRAPIWVAPPPPPPAPPAPSPPPPKPPLRLQLIAIIEQPVPADEMGSAAPIAPSSSAHTRSLPRSIRAALCYDPERDMLVTIRDGQRAPAAGEPAWGGRTGVARVTPTSLTLGEGAHATTLTLAGPSPSAAEVAR